MIFETVRSEGLAHFSYVLGDEQAGVCAVIDPRRDVDVYLEIARKNRARITAILETHVHADFVSGSRELAAKTGAPIYVGANGAYGFAHEPLADGDTVELGDFALDVHHTPGHTREHVCFLARGGAGASAPWGLFTGDTLFAGEVGRPDIPGEEHVAELARLLHKTLRQKVLPLGDELIIYPAHGEGSPCGASIGARPTSTIGYERRHNPLLQIEEPDRFTQEILASLPPVPAYYSRMKRVNAQGPVVLGSPPYLPPLNADDFMAEMEAPNTLVLDTREIEAFGAAHIPRSLNVALRKPFPVWAGRILDETLPIWTGWIVRPENRILLVLPDASDVGTVHTELLRVGYDNLVGYLRQGIRGWTEAGKPISQIGQMSVHRLKERVDADDEFQILDVRSETEWQAEHIPTATHIYVPDLEEQVNRLDRERPVAVYCGSGYRASIAASLLKRERFREVYNVPGSITAWKDAGYPLTRPAAS